MEPIITSNSKVEIKSIENSSLKSIALNYNKIAVLVDENTKVLLPKITQTLQELSFHIIEIKSGEKEKNIETCQLIWEQLITLKIDRKSLLINLGGGVITDMGAFVASTYKRGIDFINVPTSLLSMVDASVGGKTGINFQKLKNNIGLFIEPKAVFCDVSMLSTLPKRELVSGIGEILKHGLIADADYWAILIKLPIEKWNWNSIVEQSIKIKNSIVLRDPLEKNERKKLNFGHTIAHAIESNKLINNESILHGEAVAIGIISESFLSYTENSLSKGQLDKITKIIQSIFTLPLITNNNKVLIDFMLQDKKNENEQINFTLLDNIGKSSINHYVSTTNIIKSLDYYRNLTH